MKAFCKGIAIVTAILIMSSKSWALEFKGINLGEPLTEALKETCITPNFVGAGGCIIPSTVAGIKANINVLLVEYKGKEVVWGVVIEFKGIDNYEKLVTALTVKYGQPYSEENNSLVDSIGTTQWVLPEQFIKLEKKFISTKLFLIDREARAEHLRQEDLKHKGAASDL